MAGKKSDVVEVSPASPPDPACEYAGTLKGRGDEAELPYVLGKWGGHVQYQCRLCPWDCLDEEGRYWEHWENVHKPKPLINHSGGILIADKSGNEVK